jgi:hypothetical protein
MNEVKTGLLVIALGALFVSALAFGTGVLTGFVIWGVQ